jgi:hypothetical protein
MLLLPLLMLKALARMLLVPAALLICLVTPGALGHAAAAKV